jgi:hypothetical protein
MEVKRCCKFCKKDFISHKSGFICQKCYCIRAIEYYHKTKKVVICECGKSIMKCNIKSHRKTNLHKRWLESNIKYYFN